MSMTSLIFLFFLLSVGCVLADRVKRADDTSPLEAVVAGLSQQLTQMSAQISALQQQQHQFQLQHDQLNAKLTSSQQKVSFTARNSADPFNVAAHGVVHYNVAPVNLGGGFDTSSGVFTCPTPGLYVFYLNCMAVPEVDIDFSIVANGAGLGNCYSSSNPSTEQGSSLATVHLSAGQKVLVTVNRDSARNVRGSVFTTFSGFLLVPDL